jgi:hypothetical protein
MVTTCNRVLAAALLVAGGLSGSAPAAQSPAIAGAPAAFDANAAQRFAGLALACVHQEFPG